MTTLEERRRDAAEVMESQGGWPDRSPWIRTAYDALPRDRFAPAILWTWNGTTYDAVDRNVEPDRWADLLYASPHEAAVTQLGSGVPNSSMSCTHVVVDMVDLLHLEPGHSVLELGTGTGWNAAILAHRAGPGRVTTMDVDADLVSAARSRLNDFGLDVEALVGDGVAGLQRPGQVDRLIATFAVERVPWAWVERTAPGGRIVFPWGRLGHVALDVAPDGKSARGWVQGLAQFMPARGTDDGPVPLVQGPWDRRTEVSRSLGDLVDNWHLRFALRALLPHVVVTASRRERGVRLALHDGTSRAALDDAGAGRSVVQESGPRRLADEVLSAWAWWEAEDRPDLYDWGMTVTSGGQRVWCRDPETGPPLPRDTAA